MLLRITGISPTDKLFCQHTLLLLLLLTGDKKNHVSEHEDLIHVSRSQSEPRERRRRRMLR
jgi:hypothetical protein